MSEPTVRPATVADALVIAHHRAAMFRDMGQLPGGTAADALVAATAEWLRHAMPAGEYQGWLAEDAAGHVVAGAGVQLRPIMPRPRPGGTPEPLLAPQALLLNVYTDAAWRRRGLAERLLRAALAWTATHGVSSVVLHASPQGRALYERLGFRATNEMRYEAAPPAWP
jgi:GNAT superfamily N-acetyltransferase